jgi:hypothetical protein
MSFGLTAQNKEDKEEAEGVKFLHTMQAKYEVPASKAQYNRNFDKAIKLRQQELNQWKAKNWHSHWCEQTRKAKIISALSFIAAMYDAQQRYDRAAEFYMQCENVYHKGSFVLQAANEYRKNNEFAKAEELFANQIKAGNATGMIDAHISLAQTFAEEGNLTAAEQTLNDFISVSLTKHDFYQARAGRIVLKELLKTQNRLSELAKIDSILNDKTCPICGCISNVVPVSYGRRIGVDPVPNHYAGCTHFPGSPQWWCNKDNLGF